MVALVKTTQIQEPSSSTVNMALDVSGGVTVGQNLAVTGTATFTGAATFTGGSSSLKLNGATSGTTTLSPSATASGTVTLPAGTGTVAVNGVSTNIVSGTSQASTSGTSITFTSIPSWVKRITVMFNGVSLNGTSNFLIQIGSGSVTSTGYISSSTLAETTGNSNLTSTSGFAVKNSSIATATIYGSLSIFLISGTTYITSHTFGDVVRTCVTSGGGTSSALSAALDRVVITTVNGTDTFDAGSINILYE